MVLRVGLAVAAVGFCIWGDRRADGRWPVVGTLDSSRVVLLSAGILVFASSALVRVRRSDA